MQDIQEIFNQIEELKEQQKEVRKEYNDTLANTDNYEETVAKAKEIREKKKQIEAKVQAYMGSRYKTFEETKKKLAELQEMITDIAMTTLMDGKTVAVKDKHSNEYEPVYKISFKKRS